MIAGSESSPYDTINVTPMLDLAYVLLVVFILMTTAAIQGLRIELPRPSNRPDPQPHPLLIVAVTASGGLLLNGTAVNARELENRLKSAQAGSSAVNVAIDGDDDARYAQIVAVIELCDRLGLPVGLTTSRIGS